MITFTPLLSLFFVFFFFNDTATTEIYTLSLHDALPISRTIIFPRRELGCRGRRRVAPRGGYSPQSSSRSEEHTSELQSQSNLVCRLLLEKKKKKSQNNKPKQLIFLLILSQPLPEEYVSL